MDIIDQVFNSLTGSYHLNQLLSSLFIILIALFLATFVRWLVMTIAQKVAKRTQSNLDDQILEIIKQPVYQTILLLGFSIACTNLSFITAYNSAILSGFKTFAVIIWFFAALRISRLLLRSASRQKERIKMVEPRTLPLFENLFIVIIFAIAAYAVFIVWEINVSAWVASAGIMGLAISFAARDSLANLFAGVFILADGPYKIGDFVVLDTGERGCVTHIGIRSSRLLTRDDVEITIPNSIMGNTKIINETAGPHPKYRIRVKVGVSYGSDIEKVREVLLDIANHSEDVCATPAPRVRFRTFGESSLDFELLCWIDEPVLRGRALDIMNCAVYNRFNAEGIEFPYPKRDVYIKSMPEQMKS